MSVTGIVPTGLVTGHGLIRERLPRAVDTVTGRMIGSAVPGKFAGVLMSIVDEDAI